MLKGLEPPRTTTCMRCGRRPARYYGRWSEGGLCRPCLENLEPELRFRVLHDMFAEDRKRWELDNRYGLETRLTAPERRTPARLADALVRAAGRAAPTEPRPTPPAADQRPERRRHARVGARLPTSLWGQAPAGGQGLSRPRAFHALSRDVSLGGVRVAAQEGALLELRAGSHLRLEILFPKPSVVLRCGATVRNTAPSRGAPGAGSLGLAFHELNLGQEATLRQFLAGTPAGS